MQKTSLGAVIVQPTHRMVKGVPGRCSATLLAIGLTSFDKYTIFAIQATSKTSDSRFKRTDCHLEFVQDGFVHT